MKRKEIIETITKRKHFDFGVSPAVTDQYRNLMISHPDIKPKKLEQVTLCSHTYGHKDIWVKQLLLNLTYKDYFEIEAITYLYNGDNGEFQKKILEKDFDVTKLIINGVDIMEQSERLFNNNRENVWDNFNSGHYIKFHKEIFNKYFGNLYSALDFNINYVDQYFERNNKIWSLNRLVTEAIRNAQIEHQLKDSLSCVNQLIYEREV